MASKAKPATKTNPSDDFVEMIIVTRVSPKNSHTLKFDISRRVNGGDEEPIKTVDRLMDAQEYIMSLGFHNRVEEIGGYELWHKFPNTPTGAAATKRISIRIRKTK